MTQITSEISKFLKAHRVRAGVSTTQCAEYLGLPESQISAYEEGLKQIPFIDIVALANLCNIPTSDIVELMAKTALVELPLSTTAVKKN